MDLLHLMKTEDVLEEVSLLHINTRHFPGHPHPSALIRIPPSPFQMSTEDGLYTWTSTFTCNNEVVSQFPLPEGCQKEPAKMEDLNKTQNFRQYRDVQVPIGKKNLIIPRTRKISMLLRKALNR